MEELNKSINKLLNLDGYKDFESAEELAYGYNQLRDSFIEFINKSGSEIKAINNMLKQIKR